MECENCNKVTVRSEDNKKDLITRMNRTIGQMNGVKKMIEDNRYCDDILIQLSAIDNSIKSLATKILDYHLHNCLVNSIKNGDETVVDEITDLFKRFK